MNNEKLNKSRPRRRNKRSAQRASAIVQPVFRKIHTVKRVIEETFDISTDGINPELVAFMFRLVDLPGYTDLTNLFDMYRIDKISIRFTPEYTELTDAALVSNAVNVYFNSVIDLTDSDAPTSVSELLQYESLVSTGITKEHSRSWVPTYLTVKGGIPYRSYVPTSDVSINHMGLKVAIPPTGVAMTFRARVTMEVSLANVN